MGKVRKRVPKKAPFELALKPREIERWEDREWHSRKREQRVQRHGEQPEVDKMRGQTSR